MQSASSKNQEYHNKQTDNNEISGSSKKNGPEHKRGIPFVQSSNLSSTIEMDEQNGSEAIDNIQSEEKIQRLTLQLQATAKITHGFIGSFDVNKLISKTIKSIQENFSLYHTALYLIDPTAKHAIIREAAGQANVDLMKSGNKIEIGSTSVVGYTARNKKVLLIKDIKKEKTYSINSLLPDTRSEAAIPLLSNKRIYGVLDLHKKEPCSFLDEEIAIINILVDQLSLAIQNSELLSKTQEYLSQNRLLHYVTTAAAASETLQESLNNVVQGLQVAFGDDHIAIMLADNNSRVLNVAAISGYPEEVKKLQVPFGQGVTGWVAKHQQLLNLNDVATDTRYMSVDDNVHAEMAIPIIYRKELLGVLNVESNRITAFSENDEEMLSTLCNNLAAIIANASLFEHIQLQKTRERLLNEATNKIHRSVDMQSIMETTASELCKALDARRIQISIQPNQSGRVIVKHHSKDDASRGVPNENNKKYKSPK